MLSNIEFAVTDVETTGLFPNGHDRIVEIAVVRVDSRANVLDEYTTLVNPQRDVGPTYIHGITARDVRAAPAFEEIAGDVVSRIAGAVFVAHNVHFDMRFVQTELDRVGCKLPEFPFLCTMSLARRVDAQIPSRKLKELCKYFGIPSHHVHSAYGDAQATVALLAACITRLGGQSQLSPADIGVRRRLRPKELWPTPPVTGKSCRRRKAAQEPMPESSYIARLVAKLPTSSDLAHGIEDYLAVLDRVLEDRRVTGDEADALLSLSRGAGLSREQVTGAHRTYMRDLIRVAWNDNVVTEAERKDLNEVRQLLGIVEAEYLEMSQEVEREIARGEPGSSASLVNKGELAGKTICFTGTFTCRINGELARRPFAEKVAMERGMRVGKACTKRLDYLVAADPDSMSGKAKKARDYGTRILAEPVFWQMMGIDVE